MIITKKKIILIITLFIFTTNVNAYTESVIDITKMDITSIQESVDKGLLTYTQLIQLYLERIDEYDDKYNSIITINKNALIEAQKLDEEYQKTGRRSLIFGIPIIVKDNIDVKGMPTTAGAKALADSYPKENAKIIQNLIDKGAIIIAKTNMSEFAFEAIRSMSSYGTVKNAYNTLYSSYGSSGGTAVAVAASFATVGIGTDTNSSIRLPANAASLVGLRPTYGLLSQDGILPYDFTRDTAGPITKNVTDNAIMLDIMAGGDGTKYQFKTSLKGKKIAVFTQILNGDSDYSSKAMAETYEPIKSLFNEKVEQLKTLGAEIIEINDFFNTKVLNYNDSTLAGWTWCNKFNEYINGTTGTIRNFNQLNNSNKRIFPTENYAARCEESFDSLISNKENRDEYRDYVISKLEGIDAVIYPNTKSKLLKIGQDNLNGASSIIAPATGFPSLAIPIGFDEDLPYGMEILSISNREQILYEIAYALETINYEYKVPEISPNLYVIDSDVTELINFYKITEVDVTKYTEESVELYNNAQSAIKDYIANYDSNEKKAEEAEILLNNYKESINNLKEKPSNNLPKLSAFVALVVCLIILLKLISKNKRKKRRKR